MNEDEVYPHLDRCWRRTCVSIFGREIGELQDYAGYLKEGLVGKQVLSSFSGKRLWVASENYPDGARFFDYETESGYASLPKAIDHGINDIKDIDSLLATLSEVIVYSGNKAQENSKYVSMSDSVTDSSFILNSSISIKSKYLAYCFRIQNGQQSFGSVSSGQSSNIVRCFYNNSLNRCFEVVATVGASDCLFSYNVWNCSDCLFSFNLRSKRHNIANVQLEKGQFDELKAKLVGEVSEELEREKGLSYSLIDIINGWMP